jgi:hypothetical protein
MSTDKTPRDTDETLALPVTDQEPATDDTAATDVTPAAKTVATPTDDTVVIASDDTTVLALEESEQPHDEPVGAAPDETRPLPSVEESRPYPSTSAWSHDEPAAYTSPIGALYAPADRPEPAPADRVAPAPDVVIEAAPAEPPRRRLRVGTVVWGLVIAAIGVGLLAWAAGFQIDVQLAMIVLLAVAGTALLVGSILSGARNARR